MDVIDQPAGEADELQHANDLWIVDAKGNRGYELGDHNEDAEGTVPRQKRQQHKHNTKHDLVYQCAFAFFVSVPVNRICKAAGKADAHTGITAKQEIVDGAKQIVDILAKHNVPVLFLLHTGRNEGYADKSEDLCNQFNVYVKQFKYSYLRYSLCSTLTQGHASARISVPVSQTVSIDVRNFETFSNFLTMEERKCHRNYGRITS